jgi:ligand-binding sensor domain-containing protein
LFIWFRERGQIAQLSNLNSPSLQTNLVYSITGGQDQDIFLGTNDGFYIIREEQVQSRYLKKDGLSAFGILSLYNADGKVWLGTEGGGVSILDQASGKFDYLTMTEEIAGNSVIDIQESESIEGSVLVTSRQGIVRINADKTVTPLAGTNSFYANQYTTAPLSLDEKGFAIGSDLGSSSIPMEKLLLRVQSV